MSRLHHFTRLDSRSELAWDREGVLSVQVPARAIVRGAPQAGLVLATRRYGERYPSDAQVMPVSHLFRG